MHIVLFEELGEFVNILRVYCEDRNAEFLLEWLVFLGVC
jgi:hypothetical protein